MAKGSPGNIILKAINVIFSLIGVGIVIFGVVFYLKWKKLHSALTIDHTLLVAHDQPSNLSNPLTPLPNPSLFIYLIIAIGGSLFIISGFGYAGTATRSPCCLLSYSVFLVTLVLVELGTAGFVYFKHNWKYVMQSDKIGLNINWSIVTWVALGILVLQMIAIVLAVCLRSAYAKDFYFPTVSVSQKSKRSPKKSPWPSPSE